MFNFIIGVGVFTFYYLIGTFLTHYFNLSLPSSIISMLLLFISLVLKIVPQQWVKQTALSFIYMMPLFFIPASLGLFDQFILLKTYPLALLGSCIISSFLVLLITAKLIDKKEEKQRENRTASEGK